MPENKNSNITLANREVLKITGVEGVTMLNSTDACIVVCGENLIIKGEDLKADKLSVETGELVIVGKISGLKFEQKHEKQGVLKRIFK